MNDAGFLWLSIAVLAGFGLIYVMIEPGLQLWQALVLGFLCGFSINMIRKNA